MDLAEFETLVQEAEGLKTKIRLRRLLPIGDKGCDNCLEHCALKPSAGRQIDLTSKKTLKGHLAKIHALQWGADSLHLISAAQDEKMIIWDTSTTNKVDLISPSTTWLLTCALASSGKFAAAGGLDNTCSVFCKRTFVDDFKCVCQLRGHLGCLTCCRFLNNHHILTSSGDTTCALWDVGACSMDLVFRGHTKEFMAMDLAPHHRTFVSASCDKKAKIWDIRSGECVQTFQGHDADINSVSFCPDGQAFVTGSDDTTCRLFDIRSEKQVGVFKAPRTGSGVTSVAVSKSGRLVFAGNDMSGCNIWDTLTTDCVGALEDHKNRVSCVGVSPSGTAVATGSWDRTIKIWN